VHVKERAYKTETTFLKPEVRIPPAGKWYVYLSNQMMGKGATLFMHFHLQALGPLQDANWKQLAN
jgi:hypothetical protein